MAKIHRRWTTEEDDILVQSIKDNPENIKDGIRKATTLIDRTFSSCINRYYTFLANPDSPKYRGTLFTLVGHTKHINGKVVSKHHTTISHKKSLWSKIKQLLKLG
jgi:hypothetical protein